MAISATLCACGSQTQTEQQTTDAQQTQTLPQREYRNAVKIVAQFSVKPECIDQFAATAKELVLASQAEEGNISYTLNKCAEDPSTFTFIEVWKSLEAIETHNASEHFQKFVPLLGNMCDGSNIKHYTEIKY
jgi:quinol monooxygenase YgiN